MANLKYYKDTNSYLLTRDDSSVIELSEEEYGAIASYSKEREGEDILEERASDLSVEDLVEKMKRIGMGLSYVDKDGGIEIYTDYNDSLSTGTIRDILESEHPQMTKDEIFSDWESEYANDYGYPQLMGDIKKELSEEEIEFLDAHKEEIYERVEAEFYFQYKDERFSNPKVPIEIMVDTGNANYDYTSDSPSSIEGCYRPETSSIRWLANQQGELASFDDFMKEFKGDDESYSAHVEQILAESKFIQSIESEFLNHTHSIGTLTFLVEMSLNDAIALKEEQAAEMELNKNYGLAYRKGNGSIRLGKDTPCGIYNSWDGAGSLLEIELSKDVVLPIKCIGSIVYDDGRGSIGAWSVMNTYGAMRSIYKDTLKGIEPHDKEKALALEEACRQADCDKYLVRDAFVKELDRAVKEASYQSMYNINDQFVKILLNAEKGSTCWDALRDACKKDFEARSVTEPKPEDYQTFIDNTFCSQIFSSEYKKWTQDAQDTLHYIKSMIRGRKLNTAKTLIQTGLSKDSQKFMQECAKKAKESAR